MGKRLLCRTQWGLGLLVVVAWVGAADAQVAEPVATASQVIGFVSATPPDGPTRTLQSGAPVNLDERVNTFVDNALLQIQHADGSVLDLAANSSCVLRGEMVTGGLLYESCSGKLRVTAGELGCSGSNVVKLDESLGPIAVGVQCAQASLEINNLFRIRAAQAQGTRLPAVTATLIGPGRLFAATSLDTTVQCRESLLEGDRLLVFLDGEIRVERQMAANDAGAVAAFSGLPTPPGPDPRARELFRPDQGSACDTNLLTFLLEPPAAGGDGEGGDAGDAGGDGPDGADGEGPGESPDADAAGDADAGGAGAGGAVGREIELAGRVRV
ncbi:MAG: hypothetical protein KDK91_04465, partial [Gammaproteobacteria bacterium]|nr:hypothetical protein [Gammaproteobacteria bacterium]